MAFVQEPFGELGAVAKLGAHYLQHHRAAEGFLDGQVHGGHTALSDLLAENYIDQGLRVDPDNKQLQVLQ